MKITTNNYQKFLTSVQKEIANSQKIIFNASLRQKVILAWNVGKLINKNISLFSDSTIYGEKLILKLSADIKINKMTLYRMKKFNSSYPTLPKNDIGLNWSHYVLLANIKNENTRQELEDLVTQNNLSFRSLSDEIKKLENEKQEDKKASSLQLNNKLRAVRGKLFTYPLINNPANEKQKFIDLGFNVFRDLQTQILSGKTIESSKDSHGEYSFKEIDSSKKKMNIYKAYLERVVDGDTLRVVLDLGFGVYHREILRLKGINAPEKNTNEGVRSTQVLKTILKNAQYLVIKTIKIDIYGRYVADVFFNDSQNDNIDAQEIADNGAYLNQILLDQGVAKII